MPSTCRNFILLHDGCFVKRKVTLDLHMCLELRKTGGSRSETCGSDMLHYVT